MCALLKRIAWHYPKNRAHNARRKLETNTQGSEEHGRSKDQKKEPRSCQSKTRDGKKEWPLNSVSPFLTLQLEHREHSE